MAKFGPDKILAQTWSGCAIGLLGGSFNPAHEGHLALSLEALRHLKLDFLWWLVSPQNPLKSGDEMAPLAERLEIARRLTANHPRLLVTDLESQLGTRYTLDSLRALKSRLPKARFVWLMGADNLQQMPRWHQWQQIFHTVPVAVFDRPTYALSALAGKAAQRFAKRRCAESAAPGLVRKELPAWVFLHSPLVPQSASALRAMARRNE